MAHTVRCAHDDCPDHNPCDDEDEDPHEDCLGIHRSSDGYQDCNGHTI